MERTNMEEAQNVVVAEKLLKPTVVTLFRLYPEQIVSVTF
jgi:hypothetical protein